MDRYHLFRRLMDMLCEEGYEISSAKMSAFQLTVEAEGEDGSIRLVADMWDRGDDA